MGRVSKIAGICVLKFEEIMGSIGRATNKLEKERKIKTSGICLLDKKGDVAFFVGKKSDNSKTLYFAYKPCKEVDHWVWCCPNREHVRILTEKLKCLWEKEKPTISVEYPYDSQIDKEKIEETIGRLLDNKPSIRKIFDSYTIMLFISEDTTKKDKALFIAFKPSRQYTKWYLFSPTEEQAFTIIKYLREYYDKIDSMNEKTRWQK